MRLPARARATTSSRSGDSRRSARAAAEIVYPKCRFSSRDVGARRSRRVLLLRSVEVSSASAGLSGHVQLLMVDASRHRRCGHVRGVRWDRPDPPLRHQHGASVDGAVQALPDDARIFLCERAIAVLHLGGGGAGRDDTHLVFKGESRRVGMCSTLAVGSWTPTRTASWSGLSRQRVCQRTLGPGVLSRPIGRLLSLEASR